LIRSFRLILSFSVSSGHGDDDADDDDDDEKVACRSLMMIITIMLAALQAYRPSAAFDMLEHQTRPRRHIGPLDLSLSFNRIFARKCLFDRSNEKFSRARPNSLFAR
jgi:hypothetical protein